MSAASVGGLAEATSRSAPRPLGSRTLLRYATTPTPSCSTGRMPVVFASPWLRICSTWSSTRRGPRTPCTASGCVPCWHPDATRRVRRARNTWYQCDRDRGSPSRTAANPGRRRGSIRARPHARPVGSRRTADRRISRALERARDGPLLGTPRAVGESQAADREALDQQLERLRRLIARTSKPRP